MATSVETEARARGLVQGEAQRRYGDVRTQKTLTDFLSYFLLAVGAAVVLVPFGWMIGTSLTARDQLFIYPPRVIPQPIVWKNYGEAWRSEERRVGKECRCRGGRDR